MYSYLGLQISYVNVQLCRITNIICKCSVVWDYKCYMYICTIVWDYKCYMYICSVMCDYKRYMYMYSYVGLQISYGY